MFHVALLMSAKFITIRIHRKEQSQVYYMAKLRQDPKTGCFEFEGTPQELLSIYDELRQRTKENPQAIQIVDTVPRKFDPSVPMRASPNLGARMLEYEQLSKRMPTVDQLTAYILCKPNFEHDILDVETKFFEKQIKSRKYGRLYRELRAKLENARKSIEISQHGAFERRSARPRNLQVYSFKPINSVLFGQPSQKTS